MENLIKSLRTKGIYISYVEDSLKINFDGDQIPGEVLQELKSNKKKLIDYLKLVGKDNDYVAIPKAPPAKRYRLSSAQKRIWIVSQIKQASVAYNMPFSAPLTLDLSDKKALDKSIKYLIGRHESLRTVFKLEEDGEVYQYITPEATFDFKMDFQDFSKLENGEDALAKYIQQDTLLSFDLEKGPLFRICFFRMPNDAYHLYYNLHHIITDEWSMEVLMKDIFICYEAFKRNELPELPELKIQYKDYAAWQLKQLEGDGFKGSEQYWKQQLAGEIPLVNLPSNKIRPKNKTYNGKVLTAYLQKQTSEQIRNLIQEHGGSQFMLLMSAFKVLVYRYTAQDDLIIGSPIVGRQHADLENQIGFYLNTIVLRNKVAAEATFEDFYNTVKTNVLNAYSHQSYPFDKLLEDVAIKRDLSRNAIFDILLDYHKSFSLVIEENLIGKIGEPVEKRVKYDIELHFTECENTFGISLHYNTDIYEEQLIHQFMNHYVRFLDELPEHFNSRINEAVFLTKEEEIELSLLLNGAKAPLQAEQTILDLISNQARLSSENEAIRAAEQVLSYSEFENQATKLAILLVQEYAIKKGDRIGVKMENADLLPVVLYGILKSGAVFVPIEPKYTSEREQFIIEDSQMKLLITTTDFMFDFIDNDIRLLSVDVEFSPEKIEIKKALPTVTPQDEAYIIYTSGSTGKPKGVLIGHESLYNYLQWASKAYLTESSDFDFGLFTSICFDLTITSLFLPLVSGGTLHVLDSRTDVSQSLQTYISKEISCIKLTPAHISVLGSFNLKSEQLSLAIVGGDTLTENHVEVLRKINPEIKIFNEYGPTEATVGCIVKEILKEDEKICIGYPIANTEIYILDENNQLLPKGTIGEIYIGGKCLAKEYVNNKVMTSEKFIENPFKKGGRIYKTGDLGCWDFNNLIDFRGRKDNQVKVKGFRIELGEIEYHLNRHSDIQEAVVLVNDVQKEKSLEAYIVGEGTFNVKEIRGFLNQKLPDYMIPQFYHQLDAFPLTHNGKIDRKELQKINNKIKANEEEYKAPSNPREELMVAIWKEEFGLDEISTTSSFFDLGGDSIRAIRVLSKINKTLKIKLDIADIFEEPTIEQLALKQNDANSLYDVEEKEEILKRINNYKKDFKDVEDVYPMSDIEIGMCYNYIANREQSVYHDQFLYPIYIESFDFALFEEAIELMVAKHDILRTAYNIESYKTPLRFIHEEVDPKTSFEDIAHLNKSEQEQRVKTFMEEERKHVPFEMNEPGLWRMRIFKLNRGEHILVFQFHHAILDGWSRASLITELNNTYFKLSENKDFIPEKLPITYKDYVIDQECLKASDAMSTYWKEALHDYKRLDCFSEQIEFESTRITITDELNDGLQAFCKAHDLTLRSVCFAAYMYTLRRLSNETDVLSGLVTNGRLTETHGDEVLGCFLNTTPFRFNSTNDTLLSFIQEVNKRLNAQRRFERLSLAELNKHFGTDENRHNPFFDNLFIYVDFHIYKNAHFSSETMASKNERILDLGRFELNNTFLDVLVSPMDNDSGVVIEWNRSRALISGLKNKELTEIYMTFIKKVVQKEDLKISDVFALMPENQKEKVFVEFNATQQPYKQSETFVDKFKYHVENTPSNKALSFKAESFSYKELDLISNQFANYLIQEHAVLKGNFVALHLPRTEHLIIALLGILKAGCAYIPLDLNYPKKRLDFIQEDTAYKLCVTEEVLADFMAKQGELSELKPKGVTIDPEDLAYVIYTSGSTGKPKGVMLEHQNLISFVTDIDVQFGYDLSNRIAATTNIAFDISVLEIFGTLALGKHMILFGEDELSNADTFMSRLVEEEIEVLQITPTRLSMIKEFLYDTPVGSLKHLIVGGEAFHVNVFQNIKRLSHLNVINAYGPTEASIWSTSVKLESGKELSIGKPLYNEEIYVVNKAHEILPIGVAGEICIGGRGLARGYLNLPEMTSRQFIKHPLKKGKRIYKTGDIGYWTPEGNLMYLGRYDNQVKVNGHRIELGEIENALVLKDSITKAVVLITENTREAKELTAYITSEEEENSNDLRKYLLQLLPPYMIPNHFIAVDHLPLLVSGKVDRKALVSTYTNTIHSGVAYELPETEEEIALVKIWEELLGNEKIGVNDDFFVLGGNSLKAISFVNQLNHDFSIEVKLADFFKYANIKELATHIQNKRWLAQNTESENEVII